MNIPLDKAEFLALFLETFAYGVFFALCWITVHILFWNRKDGIRTGGFLLYVALFMLVLATAHLIIDFVRAINAFLLLNPGGDSSDSADSYYGNLGDPLFIAKTVLYWSQTLCGDSVIIWRCYMVYGRQFLVIVPPILFMFPAFAAGVIIINDWVHTAPGTPIFVTETHWITTFFVVTMTINIYCTAMISWRIYSTGRFRSGMGLRMGSLLPVMIVIIESGALYTSGIIAFLCTYLAGSNGQYPALDLITPLVGIVFCLIILQVRFNSSSFSSSSSIPTGSASRPIAWGRRGSRSAAPGLTTTENGPSEYPLGPISIDITTHTEDHSSFNGLEAESKSKAAEAENNIV